MSIIIYITISKTSLNSHLIDLFKKVPLCKLKMNDLEKTDQSCTTNHDEKTRNKRKIIDFYDFLKNTNSMIEYIKSGSTGHTFKGIIDNKFIYAIKIVAYPIKTSYGKINNLERPENVDIYILELLSKIVDDKKSPHLMIPYGCFYSNIEPFVNLKIQNNSKYKEFKKMYKKKLLHSHVSVLISEFAELGDLLEYIRKEKKENNLSTEFFKVVFFQLIYTLAIIQDIYPTFKHNDLKCNNILLQKSPDIYNRKTVYKIAENNKMKFCIPNIGIQIKLWDFDFSTIDGVINNLKIKSKWTNNINITNKKNHYYDLHFFFNTLIKKGVYPEILDQDITSREIIEFINDIVPSQFREDTKNVTDSGRLLVDVEYITPKDILVHHNFFDQFRL